MEKKKKKLTITISSKKPHNVSNYVQKSGQKTSVVIEQKKTARKWGEKKFHSRNTNFSKSLSTNNFYPKKSLANKNFDIRKMAEERAARRFKGLEEEKLQ